MWANVCMITSRAINSWNTQNYNNTWRDLIKTNDLTLKNAYHVWQKHVIKHSAPFSNSLRLITINQSKQIQTVNSITCAMNMGNPQIACWNLRKHLLRPKKQFEIDNKIFGVFMRSKRSLYGAVSTFLWFKNN